MKKIFFVGGAGFIGSVLVPKLLRENYRVTVLDKMLFGDKSLPFHENLTVICGDINDHELVKKLLNEKYDIVINFVVVTDDTGQPELEKIRISSNLDSCFFLAEEAKRTGVERFIYASSTSVYGNVKHGNPVTENDIPMPLSDYGKFKYECEKFLLKLSSSDFCVTCVRPSTVFGCSTRPRFDLLINNLIMTSCVERKMMLAGHSYIRPNIHIEDITDFYALVIRAPKEKVEGQVFNVADNNITIENAAEQIRTELYKLNAAKTISFEFTEPTDHRSYNVSSLKAEKELNFKPSHRFEEAVKCLSSELLQGVHVNPMTDCKYFNKNKPGYTV